MTTREGIIHEKQITIDNLTEYSELYLINSMIDIKAKIATDISQLTVYHPSAPLTPTLGGDKAKRSVWFGLISLMIVFYRILEGKKQLF